jgi:hypothetical protein
MACQFVLNPGGGCANCPTGCGGCCLSCGACSLSEADYSLSVNGGAAINLSWNGSVPGPQWTDGTYTLSCVSGNLFLAGGGSWTRVSTTCNPLSVSFTDGGNTAVVAGPTWGASNCCQTFTIRGCNSALRAGATVRVYDTPGGTLLASGVTPANGIVRLMWSASCAVYVTATDTSPNYAVFGQSYTLTNAGSTSITIPPIAGYGCCIACDVPIPTTLFYTDARGTHTITLSAGSNLTTVSVNPTNTTSFPGCNGAAVCVSAAAAYQISVTCPTAGKLRINRVWGWMGCSGGGVGYATDFQCAGGFDSARVDINITCGGVINITGTPTSPGGTTLPDPVGGPVTVTS